VPTVIISGSGGLIGSEAAAHFVRAGYDVVGIENDMRAHFFGPEASTAHTTKRLLDELPGFQHEELDIRDADGVLRVFERHSRDLAAIVHTAAQPSHDWAASDPQLDFAVNANGTVNMLEATRRVAPSATFIFTSTNKVYGDTPNRLPLEDRGERLELPEGHPYHGGIDTSMSIDSTMHSLFGASKVAADVMVQEYGRYFDMPTVCFRGGCLTGPAHAGAEAHGFLAYLMKCVVTGQPYTIYGYDGKQVRDNIHAHDVVSAMEAFHSAPRAGAVYNLGGGRDSNCSMREAIAACERISGKELDWTLSDQARMGDHRWWISDMSEFRRDYSDWQPRYDLETTLREIHDANVERWAAGVTP
jgi:CDP-paratose 2-epimerase